MRAAHRGHAWRHRGVCVARALLLSLALQAGASARAAEHLVADQTEYRRALERAAPGDAIILADGEWRDFEIVFAARGLPGKPVTLAAETPGGVVVTGRSNLRLAGEHLVVRGLTFRDGHTPTSAVIAFRRTKTHVANHSRVTEVVIDRFNNPERHETDFWVTMYGRNNRFDHSFLAGKRNAGVTMAVRLDSEASQENGHRIDHNYFGPRPILGSNGGETLRIGTSRHSLTDSRTVVERNWFERCNGEVEIVSSKSGGNLFRGNVFVESRGTLTLRHGNGIRFEGNLYDGVDKVPDTVGFDQRRLPLQRGANGLAYPAHGAHPDHGVPRDLAVLQREEAGPAWYPKPAREVGFGGGRVIAVAPGQDTLTAGVAASSAGDVVELSAGEYVVTRILDLSHPLTLRARQGAPKPPRIRFQRSTLIELADGGSVELIGLDIGGAVLSVYRGGTDESTFGPTVSMRDNVLEEVGRSRRNRTSASMALHGAQTVTITDNALAPQPAHSHGQNRWRTACHDHRQPAREHPAPGAGNGSHFLNIGGPAVAAPGAGAAGRLVRGTRR